MFCYTVKLPKSKRTEPKMSEKIFNFFLAFFSKYYDSRVSKYYELRAYFALKSIGSNGLLG